MALLLILFALFGFVMAGIGSGSNASGSAHAPPVREPSARASLRTKNTSCVVSTRVKAASAQQHRCRRSPAKP